MLLRLRLLLEVSATANMQKPCGASSLVLVDGFPQDNWHREKGRYPMTFPLAKCAVCGKGKPGGDDNIDFVSGFEPLRPQYTVASLIPPLTSGCMIFNRRNKRSRLAKTSVRTS